MRISVSIAAACLVLAGCASSSQRMSGDSSPTGLRWAGSFQHTTERSAGVGARGTHRLTGSISMMESRSGERMRIHVSLSAPGHQSTTLTWAVLPGQCGTAAFPVLSYQQFPTIEIGSNGRGEVTAELPIRLEVTEAYHANVYFRRGMELSDVLTCTNLRLH